MKISNHEQGCYWEKIKRIPVTGYSCVLTIEETTEVKIIRPDTSKFVYDFTYFIKKVNEHDNTSAIKCKFFTVNKKTIDLSGIVREKTDGNNITNEAIIELEGEKEYYVTSKIILTYNINMDYEYKFFSERIIDYTRVYVKHTDNLRVIFIPIGSEDFHDITIPDQNISKVYTDLLLPEKGFRLIFVKN